MVRSDEAILKAYETNKHVYSGEIRRLYELMPDPWNFTSEENLAGMRDYVQLLDGIADLSRIDVVIDFGCGVGALASVIKERFPTVKIVGLDFDIALERGEQMFPPGPFDVKIEVSKDEAEDELLDPRKYAIGPLEGKRVLVNHLNSIYYLFNNRPESEVENNLVKLNSLLFNLVPGAEERLAVVANSGFNYPPGNNAMFRMGLRRLATSHLVVRNSEADFCVNLNIRSWTSGPA